MANNKHKHNKKQQQKQRNAAPLALAGTGGAVHKDKDKERSELETATLTAKSRSLSPSLILTLSGDQFLATDPKNNHSITLPCDVNGLRVLKLILRARELSPTSSLGSPAQPTQAMVEEFLKKRTLEELVKEEEGFKDLKDIF
jgi:hypothetical protein